MVRAILAGLHAAVILPVGGGKNLILNACTRAAQRLQMRRSITIEVSFYRALIFDQLEEYGTKTTFVTPVEGGWYSRDGESGRVARQSVPPTSAPHVIADAVKYGRSVIATTPEFLANNSGRSANARADVLSLAADGRLLVLVIDEAHTLKAQQGLRGTSFDLFVLFTRQLYHTILTRKKKVAVIATTGTSFA